MTAADMNEQRAAVLRRSSARSSMGVDLAELLGHDDVVVQPELEPEPADPAVLVATSNESTSVDGDEADDIGTLVRGHSYLGPRRRSSQLTDVSGFVEDAIDDSLDMEQYENPVAV